MPKETYIHTRIDPDIKQQAELVFSRIGLNLTDAVSLFLTQVTLRDGLPFPLTIPECDIEYSQRKQALIDLQKARFRAMLEEAEADIYAGLVYTPEEARALTKGHLEKLKASSGPT